MNELPIQPAKIFNVRKNASNTKAATISVLFATCPFFLASSNFLGVASSVFSPPTPSFANN